MATAVSPSLAEPVPTARLTGAYGGLAAVMALAVVQILFAAAYLVSCESRSRNAGECEPQWVAAQALLFGAGGTTAGLFTRNPLLQEPGGSPSVSARRRDGHGRFAPAEPMDPTEPNP